MKGKRQREGKEEKREQRDNRHQSAAHALHSWPCCCRRFWRRPLYRRPLQEPWDGICRPCHRARTKGAGYGRLRRSARSWRRWVESWKMRIASAPYGFAKTSEIPLSRPQALSEAMEQEVQLRESRFERRLESEEKDAAPSPQAAPQRQGEGDALAADYRGAFFRRVQHYLAGCGTTLSLSRGEPSHCAHFHLYPFASQTSTATTLPWAWRRKALAPQRLRLRYICSTAF